ncbi:MAG: hypothetical protein ACUVQP_10990, partial [Bacteroidales bacterium]
WISREHKRLQKEYIEQVNKLSDELYRLRRRPASEISRAGRVESVKRILVGKYIIKKHIDIFDIDDVDKAIYEWLKGNKEYAQPAEIRPDFNDFMEFLSTIYDKINIFPTVIAVDDNEKKLGLGAEMSKQFVLIKLFTTVQKIYWASPGNEILIFVDGEYYEPPIIREGLL